MNYLRGRNVQDSTHHSVRLASCITDFLIHPIFVSSLVVLKFP